jgi:orotidine-5'-phosphate decarboxylase
VHFADRLWDAVRRVGNPVLVGIDPRADLLPEGFRDRFPPGRGGDAAAFAAFSRELLDVVADRVAAVKLQCAFFEACGPAGMHALAESAAAARARGLIVILDGKRNDIGSTAEAYAEAYLGGGGDPAWPCDALTVTPYLGSDGIAPFARAADAAGKGLFVLVRTSNPSAGELQDLSADGRPVYRHVAERLGEWAAPHRGSSGYSHVGAVVGATYPEQLGELRAALPGVIFLVPGYGAQGGTARDVSSAFDADGFGAIVNNSRGLAFAYRRPEYRARFGADWQGPVAAALDAMIADLAAHTPAGRLAPGG